MSKKNQRMNSNSTAASTVEATLHRERRAGEDRRRNVLHALVVGSFNPRRRRPRREREHHIAALDWHHPQWLAVAMLIVLLSVTDALLTLTLLNLGAHEANPFMAPLVGRGGYGFVAWKFGLTAGGVVLLTLVARMRVFGRIPVAMLLYTLLALYALLICYELWLIDQAGFGLVDLA
jgi:hypothetical protein